MINELDKACINCVWPYVEIPCPLRVIIPIAD